MSFAKCGCSLQQSFSLEAKCWPVVDMSTPPLGWTCGIMGWMGKGHIQLTPFMWVDMNPISILPFYALAQVGPWLLNNRCHLKTKVSERPTMFTRLFGLLRTQAIAEGVVPPYRLVLHQRELL